jgi:hypothetical protein
VLGESQGPAFQTFQTPFENFSLPSKVVVDDLFFEFQAATVGAPAWNSLILQLLDLSVLGKHLGDGFALGAGVHTGSGILLLFVDLHPRLNQADLNGVGKSGAVRPTLRL